jgi:predicted Rdx family selenoprotein
MGEVALQPSTGGTFKIYLYNEEPAASEDEPATIQEYLLWDRKAESGFPGMMPLFSCPSAKILLSRRTSKPLSISGFSSLVKL